MYRSEIHKILDSFIPVSLDNMDKVRLMNRVEKKYVFCTDRIPALLSVLADSYYVLEINNTRIFPYCTTYLDTPDLYFYTQQVRGKLNRFKIRYRRYETTGVSFLEIKKKTNKNRTIKWRIENSLSPGSPDSAARVFIKRYLHSHVPELKPMLINGFSRITLVGKATNERITLDYDLNFASPFGNITALPFLAVAEIKREKHSSLSPFGYAMKRMNVRPGSFSKYCVGSALIMDVPRKNILKPNLLQINKIENEYLKSDRA